MTTDGYNYDCDYDYSCDYDCDMTVTMIRTV